MTFKKIELYKIDLKFTGFLKMKTKTTYNSVLNTSQQQHHHQPTN